MNTLPGWLGSCYGSSSFCRMRWFRCCCCACQSDDNYDHNNDHGNLGKDQHRCVQNDGPPQQVQAHTPHIHKDHTMNTSCVQTHIHSEPDVHPLIVTTTCGGQRGGFPDQPMETGWNDSCCGPAGSSLCWSVYICHWSASVLTLCLFTLVWFVALCWCRFWFRCCAMSCFLISLSPD